jgi:uncharacterized membrane protein
MYIRAACYEKSLNTERISMPKHVVYSLMAAGLWGFWAVFAKLSADRIGHHASALIYSTFAFLTVLGIFVASGQSLRNAGISGSALAVVAGVLGGLALASFQKAMSTGPLGTSVSLTALYPAIPVLFGLLFLSEQLSVTKTVGILLAIAAGVLLSV